MGAPSVTSDCDLSSIYIVGRLLGIEHYADAFAHASGSALSAEARDGVDAYLSSFATPSASEWHELNTLFSHYMTARLDVSGYVPSKARKFIVEQAMPHLVALGLSDNDAHKTGLFIYATAVSPDAA